ncbi:hypothetical protein SESBI_07960 [Sesbania bispinosa]|nr:hypothetical protein SESBI_07960 [Sesbania bispinosa]
MGREGTKGKKLRTTTWKFLQSLTLTRHKRIPVQARGSGTTTTLSTRYNIWKCSSRSALTHMTSKGKPWAMRFKEALSHATCPTCGGPSVGEMSFDEQHLRIENARLREEIQRMLGMTAKMMGKLVTPFSYNHMPSCMLDLGGGNYVAQSSTIGEVYGSGNFLIGHSLFLRKVEHTN